jgi:hypothetical protein
MQRPQSRKAALVENAAVFLLTHFSPRLDQQVIVMDMARCESGVCGRCYGQMLIHVPYRVPTSELLFILGHEWGHSLGLPTEDDCSLLGMLMAPVLIAFGEPWNDSLVDHGFTEMMFKSAVQLGELPYADTAEKSTPGMLEALIEGTWQKIIKEVKNV